MTPAGRYRWSCARCDWWDWWVPCPACGYPMAIDIDEYCDFCLYFPGDGVNVSDSDPDLAAARANVERTGMAEPACDEDDDWWRPMVEAQMAPGLLERKARFADGFSQLVRFEQRGLVTPEQVMAQMETLRMAFYQVGSAAALPEPLERAWRRNQGRAD